MTPPTTFTIEGAADLDELRRRLAVHQPGTIDDAPAILSFDRARSVELPWADLVRQYAGEAGSSVAAIRDYFEQSWQGVAPGSTPGKDTLLRLTSEGLIGAPLQPEAPEPELGSTLHFLADLGPENPNAKPEERKAADLKSVTAVTTGVVLRHGTSGRHYLVLSDDDELTVDDFTNAYAETWERRVRGVELVHVAERGRAGEVCRSAAMTFEELDLRASFIVDRYRELDALEDIAKLVSTEAGVAAKEHLAGIVFDEAAVESLRSNYLNARMGLHRVERQRRRLKQQAADMGYVLMLGGEKLEKNPDGTPLTMSPAPGNLYRRVSVPYTWKVKHQRAAVAVAADGIWQGIKWFFGGGAKPVKTTYETASTGTTVQYRLVDVDTDPLAVRIDMLAAQGRMVYVLEETDDGYVAQDGTPLELIMARCDNNEEYRRLCVVMLPDYERSLTGERVAVGYRIFHRPLPGIAPVAFPQLAVLERLSYRTAWKRTELGEFVNSTTLAPGESRTLTVTRSFDREMTASETKTSVFELGTTESTDLATEMERTTRLDNEWKVHADFTQEANYGVPGNSGKSKLDAGTSNTLKVFAQDISRSARKAARSINQRNRQEVSSSTTEKTTVHNSDTTTTTIENINSGRSLNLMFFRLYNRYQGSLYLESMQLRVMSGLELIVGSGVRGSKSYRVSRIGDAFAELSRTPLPISLRDAESWDLRLRLLDELETVLAADYQNLLISETPTDATNVLKAPPAQSLVSFAATLEERLPRDVVRAPATRQAANQRRAEFETRLTELADKLHEFDVAGMPVVSSDILVATRGLYLDAAVGLHPSTEPYSEDLRTEELRRRRAETDQLTAAAALDRARAQRLLIGGANRIVAVVARDKRTLLLRLERTLSPGSWSLELDGEAVGGSQLETLDTNEVRLTWKTVQSWLSGDADLTGLALVDGRGDRVTMDL